MRRRIEVVTFMLALLLFAPVWLLAQNAEPMPDPKAAGAQAILAVGAIATAFVVWGFKLLISKLPANVILFAVPVLGIAINYAVAYLAGHPPADPMLAALSATAATWLRELVTTLPKGLAAFTQTKGSL